MSLYFESSALAKLLRDEPGHEVARSAFASVAIRVTSVISYPEICAALAAWYPRLGVAAAAAHTELDAAWRSLHLVELDEVLAGRAGAVALRHRLRGMDAIHLAAALELAGAVGDPVTFVSWDRDQRGAAGQEGLLLLPEKLP